MTRRAIGRCVECGKRALFMTPRGLLCGHHALRAIEDGEEWMPVSLASGKHLRLGRHETGSPTVTRLRRDPMDLPETG